jgi:hypothetical protein
MIKSVSISTVIVMLFGLSILPSNVMANHHEADDAHKSTKQVFTEMCKLFEGRWAVDVIWINEWPGAGAVRGETVRGYTKFERVLDGESLRWSGMQGNEEIQGFMYYDANASLIRSVRLTSGGNYSQAVMWRISESVYGFKLERSGQKDGSSLTGSGRWTFSNGGKSLKVTSNNFKSDGKDLGELKDMFHKVSP